MQKKILYVITKSNFGGAQRYVFDLAQAFHAKQYDVVVALGGTGKRGDEKGTLASLLDAQNIKTIFVPHFARDIFFINDILAFFELIQIIQTEKPDVLHTNSSKAGGLGALAGRLCGVKKIIFTSHGLTFDESWRPWWQRLLIRYTTWLTILLSHNTILISSDNLKTARGLGFVTNKLSLIYNGIGNPRYAPRADARLTITELSSNKPQFDCWVGMVAELHPNKNIDVAIKAVAALVEKNIHVELFVIGAGEMREQLQSLAIQRGIAKQVHLLGFVMDASRFVTAFDTFILTSKKEGLPYVLLEAGKGGVACIASDIGGNRDIIDHKENGFLVEQNETSLADAIQLYCEDRELRERHARALQSKIETTFSIETMTTETKSLYQ